MYARTQMFDSMGVAALNQTCGQALWRHFERHYKMALHRNKWRLSAGSLSWTNVSGATTSISTSALIRARGWTGFSRLSQIPQISEPTFTSTIITADQLGNKFESTSSACTTAPSKTANKSKIATASWITPITQISVRNMIEQLDA